MVAEGDKCSEIVSVRRTKGQISPENFPAFQRIGSGLSSWFITQRVVKTVEVMDFS